MQTGTAVVYTYERHQRLLPLLNNSFITNHVIATQIMLKLTVPDLYSKACAVPADLDALEALEELCRRASLFDRYHSNMCQRSR